MKSKLILVLAILSLSTLWAQPQREQAEKMRHDAEMQYFSIESVKRAYEDFCCNKDYDAKSNEKYQWNHSVIF